MTRDRRDEMAKRSWREEERLLIFFFFFFFFEGSSELQREIIYEPRVAALTLLEFYYWNEREREYILMM